MSVFMWPEDRWEQAHVHVSMTAGPERIYDDEAKEHRPRRVGFGVLPDVEPLRWEGDDS